MTDLTRRALLRSSAQSAAGFALASPLLAAAEATAATPAFDARAGAFAGRATMLKWNRYLAGLGTRHTGSPSEQRFVSDIRVAMRRLGWDIDQTTQRFERWEAKSWDLKLSEAGGPEQAVPVGHYFPYSADTGPGGVAGELAYAGPGATAADYANGDFRGKIAVIDVEAFKVPVGVAFNAWFDLPSSVDGNAPYDRTWVAFPPSLAAAKAAGAIGAIVILAAAPDDAKGQYTPFGRPIQGIPALHVDAQVGARIRELSKRSGNAARLTLDAVTTPGKAKDLLAVLPGRTKEVVVVNTHTDGTNLIEENGPLAMISIAQRLSKLKRSQRRATYAFYFATGHFQDTVQSAEHYFDYSSVAKRTKAGVTVEHLGCPEYVTDHVSTYKPSGKAELAGVFSSNEKVARIAQNAIDASRMPRTVVIKPQPAFFGEGKALHDEGIPMMSFIAGPSYLLAERDKRTQLARFDVDLMLKQTAGLHRMIAAAGESAPAKLR